MTHYIRTNMPGQQHTKSQHNIANYFYHPTAKKIMNKYTCRLNSTTLVILSIFLMFIITTHALQVNKECSSNSDCRNPDKICHQERCICKRDKPVEDTVNNICLGAKNVGETCSITEQCLAQSTCLEGKCSCGDKIQILNPSAGIDYCHEKKKLTQSCSHDLQCPEKAYCSLDKFGCLCMNGYAEKNGQCVPKKCINSAECESEFHQCQDNLCMCLPGNFDLTTAKCYKFGSNEKDIAENSFNGTNFIKDILGDLKSSNSDNLWIILIIIIVSVLLILSLLILLFKKHYLSFCFTSYKKEYEPNNKSAPKNGFHSNPINNKSFKRKLENDSQGIANDYDRTGQSDNQLRKSSDVDVNLDINEADEHEVMISGKINKPLVNPTSTTV